MKLLSTRQPTLTEQLQSAAIDAAISALADRRRRSKDRPALKGVRAVAAGAVLYTAGRAAFKGRRLLREQLSASPAEDDDAAEEDEPDDRSSSETAAPPAHRAQVGQEARRQDAQPSLRLPQQRWPRLSAGRS
jgi:hypothetical protein